IPASDLTATGTEPITVVTPGGGISSPQTFTVNPAPTVQFSAASETVNETAGTFSITVNLSAPVAQTFSTFFGSGLNSPRGLAFDASGNLYVANSLDGTVSKVTPAGVLSTFASGLSSP